MPSNQEIIAQLDALQVVTDELQDRVANALSGLNAQIETLTALVAEGGTSEERQAILDEITVIANDLAGTPVY